MLYLSRKLCVLALLAAATAAGAANPDNATTGPWVTDLKYAPPAPGSTEPVAVTAKATDDKGIATVSVAYTVPNKTTPTTVPALDDGEHGDGSAGDSVFGALLPPQPAGARVTFQWTATGNSGKTTDTASRSYISARPPGPEFRAVWADSWEGSFRSTTEAQSLVDVCRGANINTIIPEVRKIGDAYYKSRIEPRADNIADGKDFDPLGFLIEQAHDTSNGKHRIQVHPWFVMHRLQKVRGPLDPEHVLVRHPEYEMVKADGTRIETRYLDPGHPGTVEHNVAVILDCLARYDIDGIHLDYIRYPEYPGSWGYNPMSVARFNALHGRCGFPDPKDPAWSAWRRECVTLQVRKIYVKAWQMKPHVILSAATVNWGGAYDRFQDSAAYNQALQDWAGWLEQGNLDYDGVMNYVSDADTARFLGWTNCSVSRNARRGSIVGVGAFLHSSIQGSMDQLLYVRSSGAAGLNIYDWGSEVAANKKGETREQFYAALKEQVFPSWVEPPAPAWKTEKPEAVFEGTVTHQGQPVDHARVWIDGRPETETVTDGTGWYGILNVPAGSHSLRVVKKGIGEGLAAGAVPQPGKVVTVNISLGTKTDAKADGSM